MGCPTVHKGSNHMKTIYRKRTTKTRYEISNGPCFVGVHFGKRSLYIGKVGTRIAHTSMVRLVDDRGYESVTTITTTGKEVTSHLLLKQYATNQTKYKGL